MCNSKDFLDLPNIKNDLSKSGNSEKIEGECSDCGGQLWRVDYETVCENCSLVAGSKSNENFNYLFDLLPEKDEERAKHQNSGKIKCAGGFEVYEYNDDKEQYKIS